MRKIFNSIILLFFLCNGFSQNLHLESFPLTDVRLLKSPFLVAQQTDMKYMLELNPDRLLAPFLIESGIPPKAELYGNWENTGLDGHIGGHYLSALSDMYAVTGDKKVLDRLNYMIDWLDTCQRKKCGRKFRKVKLKRVVFH